MGISALGMRSGSAQSIERDKLRDDLRRHINTWPEIRANRYVCRYLSISTNKFSARWRPTLLLRRHSGGNLATDRPMSSYNRNGAPTSPPQDPTPNPINIQMPQKSIVVITPTNKQSIPRHTLNIINRSATGRSKTMIQSSVF
jgi:hypothetical protein